MLLLTLRAAAIKLGVSEPTARRLLASHVVWIGSRKKYPVAVVDRIVERGTR